MFVSLDILEGLDLFLHIPLHSVTRPFDALELCNRAASVLANSEVGHQYFFRASARTIVYVDPSLSLGIASPLGGTSFRILLVQLAS